VILEVIFEMKANLKFIITGILFTSLIVLAQEKNHADLFNQALILYRNQHFEKAKEEFMSLVADPQSNSRITASYFMLAKSLQKLNQPDQAIFYAELLINQYPSSRYKADAYYLIAQLLQQQYRYSKALSNCARVFANSTDSELIQNSFELGERIAEHGIAEKDIRSILQKHSNSRAKPYTIYLAARAFYGLGDKTHGDRLIENLVKTDPPPLVASRVSRISELPIEALVRPVRMGLVLPMSGYFARESEDFIRGLAVALKERQKNYPKIELIVKDSRGNTVGTVNAGQEIFKTDIQVCIGELEGSKSATLAGLAVPQQIPLIVPVASENGITSIGGHIFQTNSDLETRGKKLAQYAFDQLGLKTFAMLAPADDYGFMLTDAFSATIDQLGGKIIAQQWYYPGTEDLKRQFLNIRQAGLRQAIRDSLLMNGESVTAEKIDARYQDLDKKISQQTEDKTGILETTDIPVTSIDGVFLPVYEEDISIVAPQFALYNIKAMPLGGSYWLNQDQLNNQRRYINNLVMVAGLYASEANPDYIQFRNRYRDLTSYSPATVSLYGYNLMTLLIDIIDSGNIDSQTIVDSLKEVQYYSGIGGALSFSERHRVNQAVNIFKYKDGLIERLSRAIY
jgi:branched-chain amino acid transport system substrate-binding protein